MRNNPDFIFSRFIESPQSFEDYDKKWKNFERLKDSFKQPKMNKKQRNFLSISVFIEFVELYLVLLGKKM